MDGGTPRAPLFSSWPALCRPSMTRCATVCMGGPDKPGHDGCGAQRNCSFCLSKKWEGGTPFDSPKHKMLRFASDQQSNSRLCASRTRLPVPPPSWPGLSRPSIARASASERVFPARGHAPDGWPPRRAAMTGWTHSEIHSCARDCKSGLPLANGNIFAVDSIRLSLRAVANEAVRTDAPCCRIERNLGSCPQV